VKEEAERPAMCRAFFLSGRLLVAAALAL